MSSDFIRDEYESEPVIHEVYSIVRTAEQRIYKWDAEYQEHANNARFLGLVGGGVLAASEVIARTKYGYYGSSMLMVFEHCYRWAGLTALAVAGVEVVRARHAKKERDT